MKILLVGEFSGVHTNLKKALIAKGHTVAIVGKHDGFKKFDSDLNVSPYIGNTIGKFKNIFYFPIIYIIFNSIIFSYIE